MLPSVLRVMEKPSADTWPVLPSEFTRWVVPEAHHPHPEWCERVPVRVLVACEAHHQGGLRTQEGPVGSPGGHGPVGSGVLPGTVLLLRGNGSRCRVQGNQDPSGAPLQGRPVMLRGP